MNRVPSFLKWLAASLTAVALFTAAFVIKGNGRAEPLPPGITATPTISANQEPAKISRLLVLVADENWVVQGASVVGHDPALTALRIANIDPRTTFDSGIGGYTSIAKGGATATLTSVTQRISVATATQADATLIIQRVALAGLIDAVGGIDITSDADYPVSKGPGPILYVTKGTWHVDGTRAAGYAVLAQPGDTPAKHNARVNQVLLATLNQLPQDTNRLDEVLLALGALARTTMPMSDVARFISDVKSNSLFAHPARYLVPTEASDVAVGTQGPWRRTALVRAAALARQGSVDLSVTPIPGELVVAVQSGFPEGRLVLRDALAGSGMTFLDAGNVTTPKTTIMQVAPRVSTQQVADLQKALGLPNPTIVRDSTLLQFTDVQITLGLDYRAKEKLTGSVN